MSLSRNFNIIKLATLLLLSASAGMAAAQGTVCKNQYPCGECAVYDNNGNDLRGFVHNNKQQLAERGGSLLSASGNTWGYLLVRTVHVPSVSSKWANMGNLNVGASIRTTLVMNKTRDGELATWWARECNLNNGPLVQLKTGKEDKVDMPQTGYEKLTHSLDDMKFTLVEYADTFNARDYENMLKNHIIARCGVIDVHDYKGLVDYYNGFLNKFTDVHDALLSNSSFVTFFKGSSNTRYVAYFNIVNGHLSGRLEVADLQYERDMDVMLQNTFTKLNGKTVYIYGNETYGMDKKIIMYGKEHDLKLKRRKMDGAKFN